MAPLSALSSRHLYSPSGYVKTCINSGKTDNLFNPYCIQYYLPVPIPFSYCLLFEALPVHRSGFQTSCRSCGSWWQPCRRIPSIRVFHVATTEALSSSAIRQRHKTVLSRLSDVALHMCHLQLLQLVTCHC